MNKIRNNEKRAKNILIVFKIMLGITFLSAISNYLEYDLLSSADYSIQEAEANDMRQTLVAIPQFVLIVLSMIFFIQWFRRAYYNLHVKGNKTLIYSEGWASGCWFIPFLNLVRPYKIMKEIWEETNSKIKYNNDTTNYNPNNILDVNQTINDTSSEFIGWWWGIYLVSNFFNQIVNRINLKAETISELTDASILNIAGNILTIPAIYLTIKLIEKTSKAETIMYSLSDTEDEYTPTVEDLQPNAQ